MIRKTDRAARQAWEADALPNWTGDSHALDCGLVCCLSPWLFSFNFAQLSRFDFESGLFGKQSWRLLEQATQIQSCFGRKLRHLATSASGNHTTPTTKTIHVTQQQKPTLNKINNESHATQQQNVEKKQQNPHNNKIKTRKTSKTTHHEKNKKNKKTKKKQKKQTKNKQKQTFYYLWDYNSIG